MRLKPMPWLMGFLILILTISSLTIYFYFKKISLEALEYRIINWTDDLVLDIVKDIDNFEKNPEMFISAYQAKEFSSISMLVEFISKDGKIILKSQNLKLTAIPFSTNEDELLRDIKFSDNSELKIYQRAIEIEGKTYGYLVVGLPVTPFVHNAERLRNLLILIMTFTIIILFLGINALASLDRLSNQKKFLSFASHELRTPLSVISGHAEVALKRDQSQEQYRETLALIKEESDWMRRMVSNLLMIFRSGSGAEKIIKSEFNFSELLADEASALKKRYPTKKIILNLSDESIIKADADQIRKLITNLLENAARYTDENGKISISLKSDAKHFILKVEDNGIGIDGNMSQKIFDPFYRIEDKKGEGMGLGLAISKWVAEAHGGKIMLESEKSKGLPDGRQGSIFTVILPKK